MSLRNAKNSKELKMYFEKKSELENWRRKFFELDIYLNDVVVKNNQIFEDNKMLLDDIDKKK